MSDFYSVHDTQQGYMKIIDPAKGTQVGVISPRGQIVTPPIVSGNQVSFVVQDPAGIKTGCVYKLPTGALINTFRA